MTERAPVILALLGLFLTSFALWEISKHMTEYVPQVEVVEGCVK